MKKESVQALCDSMRAFGLSEGKTSTAFPFLTFYRFTSAEIEIPQTENFHIYTVADGSLRLFTPSGILDYVPGQYSISQIAPLPPAMCRHFPNGAIFLRSPLNSRSMR